MTTQTDLEIAAGRAAIERGSALTALAKNANGSTAGTPPLFIGGKPTDTGIVAAVTAMQTQALKPDMPSSQPDASAYQVKHSGGENPQAADALKAAEIYIRAGWHVFPGNRREKTPMTGWSWTKNKLALADAPEYFANDQHNVLVALGKASDDVVDIDLDWIEATAAADLLMRALPSFGRGGKPRSHRLAICGGIKSQKYLLPQSLADHSRIGREHAMCIAEVRGSGSYTVFPGSQHETGQPVEWTNAVADNIPALQPLDHTTLLKSMGLLSFVAFCMRFFPAVGTRCDFMMAVAGALAHAGHDSNTIQKAVQAIGAFNHDEGDNGAWRVAADSVGTKVDEGTGVTGLPTLIKILGMDDDVLQWCRRLLDTPNHTVTAPWPGGHNDETGKPKRGILNTIEAIKRLGITCTYDEFRQKEYWFGHTDQSFNGEVSDAAVTVVRRNICANFQFYPGAEETRDAITDACRDNKTNPVLAYFNGLKWDGKPRLDKMLPTYLGADDTPLNKAIGRKFMCAIVRRTKKPGCKFDHQPVLQGSQGVRKSTFCEDLAVSADLFTDAGDLSLDIKQLMEIGQGKQIIEFPEHAGFSRSARDRNKAALSRKVDRARMAYAHYATDTPRQWIAVATINPGGYLNDPTGERRYWHVEAARYDRDAFLADKEQLYAEAVVREPDENLWLDTPALLAAHDAVVATAKEPNELVDLLATLRGEVWHVNGKDEERVSTQDIRFALGMNTADAVRAHNIGRRILEAMMVLGWTKAPGTIRCHKGQDATTGYTRPVPRGSGCTGTTGTASTPPPAGPAPTGPTGPDGTSCAPTAIIFDRLLTQGTAQAQADHALFDANS